MLTTNFLNKLLESLKNSSDNSPEILSKQNSSSSEDESSVEIKQEGVGFSGGAPNNIVPQILLLLTLNDEQLSKIQHEDFVKGGYKMEVLERYVYVAKTLIPKHFAKLKDFSAVINLTEEKLDLYEQFLSRIGKECIENFETLEDVFNQLRSTYETFSNSGLLHTMRFIDFIKKLVDNNRDDPLSPENVEKCLSDLAAKIKKIFTDKLVKIFNDSAKGNIEKEQAIENFITCLKSSDGIGNILCDDAKADASDNEIEEKARKLFDAFDEIAQKYKEGEPLSLDVTTFERITAFIGGLIKCALVIPAALELLGVKALESSAAKKDSATNEAKSFVDLICSSQEISRRSSISL